jgi:hypothetical protein
MITIFSDFRQKMAFFSKTNVTIKFVQYLVLFWADFFGENIFKSWHRSLLYWKKLVPENLQDVKIVTKPLLSLFVRLREECSYAFDRGVLAGRNQVNSSSCTSDCCSPSSHALHLSYITNSVQKSFEKKFAVSLTTVEPEHDGEDSSDRKFLQFCGQSCTVRQCEAISTLRMMMVPVKVKFCATGNCQLKSLFFFFVQNFFSTVFSWKNFRSKF